MTFEQAVLQTITYLDMFGFAPTLLEVHRWLLKHDGPASSLSDIKRCCEQSPRIENKQGLFFLTGRDDLIRFKKVKYNLTDQKWKRVKPFLRMLAAMPHVQAIWFVNSMGWQNSRIKSDIDLLIISDKGKIWSTRFFTTALMKILRQRPHEQKEEKAICLSMYMSADQLNLEQYKIGPNDIHFSFWCTQFYPVYDNGLFKQYAQANKWLGQIFQNNTWVEPSTVRQIKISWFEKIIKNLLRLFCIEFILKKIQLFIMPKKLKEMANIDKRVVINDHILKLHTNDARNDLQQDWERTISKYV